MDFGTLLHAAQKNEHKAKLEPKKCYSTSFSAPKKDHKSSKELSANIQKFLARREQEEKKKELEARQKRDELLALRSQDGKAKKRVAAMLKRTKAANKSVIEDAIDEDNTAVTINGPSQPDEDDYGYVSQEASAFYNKLMDKYSKAPVEEPLYSEKKKVIHKDLNSTKDRVRMALLKEEEEEMMPHKRKRKSKTKDDAGDTTVSCESSDRRDVSRDPDEDSNEEQEPEHRSEKPKFKKPLPPPAMNFHDLLKLAEKKQFEPIKIEPKKKPEDNERPMTKKQRIEFMKEQEWRQRKEEAAAAKANRTRINSSQSSKILNRDDSAQKAKPARTDKPEKSMRIPKLNGGKREEKIISYRKEEERPVSGFKKEDKYSGGKKEENQSTPSPKIPRQNGNLSRDNVESASLKFNMASKNNVISNKISKYDDVPKKNRTESENSLNRRLQSQYDEGRTTSSKNNFVQSQSTPKRLPVKTSENKNSDSVLKDVPTSGYDKKLQEAIIRKMEETQKKKKVGENLSVKSYGKPPGRETVSKCAGDSEKGSLYMKTQGKLLPKSDRAVEQNQNTPNQRLNGFGMNRTTQESNFFQNRLSGPSVKAKAAQLEEKPNPGSSTTRKYLPGDLRAKEMQIPAPQSKPGFQGKPNILPDGRSRTVPPADARPNITPDVRSRTVPPADARRNVTPDGQSRTVPRADARPKQMSIGPPQRPPPSDARPKQLPPADVKPKQFPPADVRPRQFPPPDVRARQFPPTDVRKKPKQPLKRRITDSEEEYDPEMDDFIDDGPEENEDYSKHIREIFGYDRRKYSRIEDDDDDDDECMESNFATILKEDYISTKTGILEDLEDIRREKEIEKRKKLAKKRKL